MKSVVVVILFAILSPYRSSRASALAKCCPLNRELSTNATDDVVPVRDLICQPSTVATLSITYTTQLRIGLPACERARLVNAYDRRHTIVCMDRISERNDVYGLACVDEQRIQQQQQQRPVYITRTRLDVNDTAAAALTSNGSSPDDYRMSVVTNVRKCCPAHRRYDANQQFCWNTFADDYDNAILDLLKIAIRRLDRFVNVTFGAPTCRQSAVLVDTVVPADQITFADEALVLNDTDEVFSFPEYCVDLVDDLFEYTVVRACREMRTECQLKGRPCVRKCCPFGYESNRHECVPSKRPLKLDFVNVTSLAGRWQTHAADVTLKPAYVFGDPCPQGKYALDEATVEDRHALTVAGTVAMLATNTILNTDQYCVENKPTVERTRTMVCFPYTDPALEGDGVVDRAKSKLTIISSSVSAFFLFLTFFIYVLLPSLRNLHGKLVMCYLLTSACSYLTVVTQLSFPYLTKYNNTCIFRGYLMLFIFLSTFSWLNIISYDIWSTFKAVRSTFLKKSSTCRRFTISCLYGWGVSLLWTMMAVVCQYTWLIDESSSFKPDIGKTRCFFSEYSRSKIVFFVAPVLTMISFNVIIFIFTVKYCSNIRSELKKSNNNYSLKRFSADKNELIINLKLFIVMGVNWSMELISLLVQPRNRTFFILSDLLNALSGVFVFCIFILKRKVLLDLKAKFCGTRRNNRMLERATGFTTSTTSSIVLNLVNSRRSVSLNP